MKTAELRSKSPAELKDLILSSKKEQFNLRMQSSTGQLENRSRMTEVRKTIARAKTILNEKPGTVKAKAAKAPKAEKASAKKKTKAKKEE